LTPGLRLGDPVNILDGLSPGWYGHEESIRVFAPVSHAPLVAFPLPDQAPTPGLWDGPRVTLHDSLPALVDALFDYRVIPSRDNPGQRPLPPSTLTRGRCPIAAMAGSIADLLGIDLARPDIGGFVLLELHRDDADHRHDVERGGNAVRGRLEQYWTREGRHAMARLRWDGENVDPDGRRRAFVTQRQVSRYLDYFYDRGTHFVARVGLGQRIFQVLVCRADRYGFLREFWQRETGGAVPATGPLAISFVQFTGPDWISSRGKLTSIGDEPELARSVQQGAWRTNGPENAAILLAPFARSPRAAAALLDRFDGCAATRVELLSQGYLMGESRVQAWQQVLNGALLQRYGVPAGQPAQGATGSSCCHLFGFTPRRAAFLDGHVMLLRDCLDTDDLSTVRSAEVRQIQAVGLCLALNSGSPVDLPGQRTALLAFRTETSDTGGNVPVVRVADEAFSQFELSTGDMRGALVVTDRSESRRETYYRGLRFGFDGSGRVIGKDDPRQPSDALLRDGRGLLESSLDMAEALLALAEAGSTGLARGHLAWVAAIIGRSGLIAADEPDAHAWRALRARALCSARLGVAGIEVAKVEPGAVRALIVLAGQAWELGQHPACDQDTARQDDDPALRRLAECLREAEEGFAFLLNPAGHSQRMRGDALKVAVAHVTAARQMVCDMAVAILASLDGDNLEATDTQDAGMTLERLIDALCPGQPRTEHCEHTNWNNRSWSDATEPLVELRQGIAAIVILGEWLESPKQRPDATAETMLQAVSVPARWAADQKCQAFIQERAIIQEPTTTLVAVTARSDPSLPSLEQAVENLRRVGAGALTLLIAEVRRRLPDQYRLLPAASLGFSCHPVLRLHAHYWRLTRLLAFSYALARSTDGARLSQSRPEGRPRLSLMEIAHALLARGS